MTDDSQSTIAKTVFAINTGVDQIGTVLFGVLIFITVKQKRLHGTCHLLLGIYAVCSLLSKIQILLPFILFMLPGYGKIARLYCALIQIIPIGGCMNVYSLMLIIGIDRMMSIFLPIWYSTRSEKHYLKSIYLVSLSFPLIFLGFVINTTIQDPYMQIQCFFADLVVCNIRKALYKTLALIMSIQIFGYIFALTAYQVVDKYSSSLTFMQKQLILCILNCFLSLIGSMEVPVLFAASTEHRLALKDEFKWLYKFFTKNTTTATTPVESITKDNEHNKRNIQSKNLNEPI
uniref:G-protein coupled receptors family 1 profile domain-containing protein n=1 Tax=Meloidogyne floridensis TaxID=298350 RepID=A0A915P6G3_9BILA